jgi:hypothetical protein
MSESEKLVFHRGVAAIVTALRTGALMLAILLTLFAMAARGAFAMAAYGAFIMLAATPAAASGRRAGCGGRHSLPPGSGLHRRQQVAMTLRARGLPWNMRRATMLSASCSFCRFSPASRS